MKVNKGTLLGIATFSVLANAAAGVLLSVSSLLILLRNAEITEVRKKLLFIAIIPMLWISLIHWTIGSSNLKVYIQVMAPLSVLVAACFVKISKSSLDSFSKIAYAFFIIDFLFNISSLLFGVDLLGRNGVYFRPGDSIGRLGGLMMHPFQSVNITLVASFFALARRHWKVLILTFIALGINGTLRAPLAALIVMTLFVSLTTLSRLKWQSRAGLIVVLALAIAASVFIATIWSAGQATSVTGNVLRVFAWKNAIANIYNDPFFGGAVFNSATIEVMNEDTIINNGIAESYILDLWMKYGFIAPIMVVSLFVYLTIRHSNLYFRNNDNPLNRARAVMSAFCLSDVFFGTYSMSALPVLAFSILCICTLD